MTKFIFDNVARYSDEWPVPAVRVMAAILRDERGAPLEVAVILEPDSPNSCLYCHKPLGFNGVQQILDHLTGRRALKDILQRSADLN